jgi:two-component system chemotaxis response regulator CheB
MAQAGSRVTIEARELGAVDVIAKPSGAVSLDLKVKKGHEIVKTIRKAMKLPELTEQ